MGTVAIFAPSSSSLLGLISCIIPVILSGNTCVILAAENKPLCAITLAEVLSTSDVPGGVVNILTGKKSEIIEHAGKHKDVNAIYYADSDLKELETLRVLAIDNLKRIIKMNNDDLFSEEVNNPYVISNFMETKTTWHPIENISETGAGY